MYVTLIYGVHIETVFCNKQFQGMFFEKYTVARVHNREESVKLPYVLSKMSPLSTLNLNGFL